MSTRKRATKPASAQANSGADCPKFSNALSKANYFAQFVRSRLGQTAKPNAQSANRRESNDDFVWHKIRNSTDNRHTAQRPSTTRRGRRDLQKGHDLRAYFRESGGRARLQKHQRHTNLCRQNCPRRINPDKRLKRRLCKGRNLCPLKKSARKRFAGCLSN